MSFENLVQDGILYEAFKNNEALIYVLVDTPFLLFICRNEATIISIWFWFSDSEKITLPLSETQLDNLPLGQEVDFSYVFEHCDDSVKLKMIYNLDDFLMSRQTKDLIA